MHAALPAHHDDDNGGAACCRSAGAGLGRGFRDAPAARHRDRRRVDTEPTAYAVYDAGSLYLSRSFSPVVPAGLGPRVCARRHEDRMKLTYTGGHLIAAAVTLALTAGCMVGPNYIR